MAALRELRKKINIVTNSKRITGTIEMVATSKMKKIQDKIKKSRPYAEKMNMLISHLLKTGIDTSSHVLLMNKKKSGKVLVLLVAGNRGLCGGLNTNIAERGLSFKEEVAGGKNKEVFFYISGKKAAAYFNYINEPVLKFIPNPEDKIVFDDALNIGNELMNKFINDEFDEIYILYTKALSFSSREVALQKLLPLEPAVIEQGPESDFGASYLFNPGPGEILSTIIPLSVNTNIYNCMLESGYAEQATRKAAMKNASDSAGDMIQQLTIDYNRARQAKITNEITEIVAGATALK